MVRPEGFEPPTREVEARCSNPLSYGRILVYQLAFASNSSLYRKETEAP
jgi:hypothetical protein